MMTILKRLVQSYSLVNYVWPHLSHLQCYRSVSVSAPMGKMFYSITINFSTQGISIPSVYCVFILSLHTGTWSAPIGEKRPDPIGAFAFPRIDCERALLFGGQGSRGRLNEAYLFYLDARVRWRHPCTILTT